MVMGRTSSMGILAFLAMGTMMMSGCLLSSDNKEGTVGAHAGPNTPVTVENAQTVFSVVFATINSAFEESLSKPSAMAEERIIEGAVSGKIVRKTTPTANGYLEEIKITDFSSDGELFIGGTLTNDITIVEHGENGAIEGNMTFAGLYKGSVGVDVMMESYGDYAMVQGMVTVGNQEVPVFFHPMYSKVTH